MTLATLFATSPVGTPPLRSRSDLATPSDKAAAAHRHRAWVLNMRNDFNQRVSRASINSEAFDESPAPNLSRYKRSSIDLSSWDADGWGSSDGGPESDLATTDEDLATTLRVALGLEEDWLVRSAMGLAPIDDGKAMAAAELSGGSRTPPRARRSSMAAHYRGPQLEKAASAVREQWAATPLPPLLHRQSMPDLSRFVRQKKETLG